MKSSCFSSPVAVFLSFFSLLIQGDAIGSENFRVLGPEEIVTTINTWKHKYPDLVEVTTAQSQYGLPTAGTKQDCLYDGSHVGCFNHFFTIQDFVTHPNGSSSSSTLPEILWTGSLHGDDILGPTVVVETSSLLLEAASCEARPRLDSSNWETEVKDAVSCRADLTSRGVDDTHRQWLARLVATRRIVVVPNANALGYGRNEHLENTVDPVEDFPYNNPTSESCMRSIAARTLNEIFRSHMFQIVVSFKTGEDSIEYSWGTQPNLSPDNIAYEKIAQSLSNVVGGDTMYPYGPSNAHSFNPNMTFQDWAYAVSWERPRTQICNPGTFGGYDLNKTEYRVETNRALSFTISCMEDSTDLQLDTIHQLFHADDDSKGLPISRNMRLALVATDLVQPYVSIFGINNIAMADDIVPSGYHQSGNMCDTSKIVAVPGALSTVIVEWTVGGALDISESDLWVVKIEDLPGSYVCSMGLSDGFDTAKEVFKKIDSLPRTGSGFFSPNGPNPSPKESVSKPFSVLSGNGPIFDAESNAMGGVLSNKTNDSEKTTYNVASRSVNLLGPVFRAEIDLADYQVGDRLLLVASARVDAEWLGTPNDYYQPIVNPQSHVVNIRTNPDHEFEISGKRLEGRLNWISVPVTVIVDDIDKHMGGVELFKRLDKSEGYVKPLSRPSTLFRIKTEGESNSILSVAISLVLIVIALIVLGLVCFVISLRRGRPSRRKQTNKIGDGVFKIKSLTEDSRQSSTIGKTTSDAFRNITEGIRDEYNNNDEGNQNVLDHVGNDQSFHGCSLVNIDLGEMEDDEEKAPHFESSMTRSSSNPPSCSGDEV